MSDSRFQPGVLVRDNRSRVGRVVGAPRSIEIDGNSMPVFTVDFWGDEQLRPERMLTLLEQDSPEALLLDRPEVLASWVDEAPLRLAALALAVDGGSGSAAEIRNKLDGRVPDLKWDSWWKRVPAQMRTLPDHFRIVKSGRDSEYSLLTSVDAVPSAEQSKFVASADRKTTAADWRAWLEAATHRPPPGRFPTTQVAASLAKWPAETIEQALLRIIVSVEELLAGGEVTAQTAEAWLRALAQASLRRREVGGADTRGYTAARAGDVLARLARIAEDRTPSDLLLRAGDLDGETDAWRHGFLAGMWEAFEGDEAREVYLRSSAVLGRQARVGLARELFAAGFGPDFSERRHSQLDRLLDALPEGDRELLLREAIASAPADQRENVLGYVANSRHTAGPENLALRMVATLTLGDGQGDLEPRFSRELADAFDAPTKYNGSVQKVLLVGSLKAGEAKFSAEAEVRNREEALEEQLEQERAEQERLRQQVRDRNAELAANREESRLELRQDMLLAVGEVLQTLAAKAGEEGVNGDIGAGLVLALRAGGAEPLGFPGVTVQYDPERHRTDGAVKPSSPVRVIAPGVIYRGGIHGDRVLLKAQVKHEAG